MIYRRRIKYDNLESIEIVLTKDISKQISLVDIQDDSIEVVMLRTEMDEDSAEDGILKIGTQIYNVDIPDYMRVKPPDWREFAYDHKEVERLIQVCVNDNVLTYIFEDLNPSMLKKMDLTLTKALEDLNSIIDLISVKSQVFGSPGKLSVCVIFSHKNGESKDLVIPVEWFISSKNIRE